MSELDLNFKSPFCDHTIAAAEVAANERVTCACGKVFLTDTIISFIEQKAATDRAYFAFDAQRKKYDAIYSELERQANGGKATAPAAAPAKVTTASAISAAMEAYNANNASAGLKLDAPQASAASMSAPSVVVEPKPQKPAKPQRPKRQPLAPRTVLLMVAALIAMVGVTVFMISNRNAIIQYIFVAVFVGASGFGAVKAHKHIRFLGNFLAALSSSVLGLALFYLGSQLTDAAGQSLAQVNTSLFLPIVIAAVSLASLFLGHRFKIAGWAALAPIGLTITTVMSTLGFLQHSGFGGSWSILVASALGVAIGYTGAKAKLPVPVYEEPTDAQLFEVADANRERKFTKQMVNLGMIVALGVMTVVYGQLLLTQLSGIHTALFGLLAVGLFWLGTAFGLERIGGRYTDSGSVSPLVIWGSWVAGFANIAVAVVSLGTSADAAGKPNYPGAFVASAVAAALLLLPRFVEVIKNSDAARTATTIGAFTAWGSWWLTTAGFSLGNADQVRVFTTVLTLMSLVWMLVRFTYRTHTHQFFAVVPGTLAAVLMPALWVSTNSGSTPASLIGDSALFLVLASALIAAVEFGNAALTKRAGGTPSAAIGVVGVAANVLLVAASWLQLAQRLPATTASAGATAYQALPLALAGIALAVARLIFLGSRFGSRDAQLERTAKIATVAYLVFPFLVVITGFMAATSAASQVIALLLAIETVIAFANSLWRRNHNYALSSVGLALALSIAVDYLLAAGGNASLTLDAAMALFLGLQVLLATSFGRFVPEAATTTWKALPILFLAFVGGHGIIFILANTGHGTGSGALAWQNLLSFLVVGAGAIAVATTKRLSGNAETSTGLTQTGWSALGLALFSALVTAGQAGASVRIATVALAGMAITQFAARRSSVPQASLITVLAARLALLMGVTLVVEAAAITSPATVTLIGFGAIAAWYLLDYALARLLKATSSRGTTFVSLTVLLSTLLGEQFLPAIDGTSVTTTLTGAEDRTFAIVLTFALTALFAGALLLSNLRAFDATAEKPSHLGLFEPIALLLFGFALTTGLVPALSAHLLISAAWLGLAALLLGYESFRTRFATTAGVSYGFTLAALWLASIWLTTKFHIALVLPMNLATIAAFAVGAWLLGRAKPEALKNFGIALPFSIGASYVFGSFAHPGGLLSLAENNTVDWIASLVLVVAYLWLANGRFANALTGLTGGLTITAFVTWAFALEMVFGNADTAVLQLLITAGIATWFALAYRANRAAYLAYGMALLSLWYYAGQLLGNLHLPFIQPINLAGLAAFSLGAWLLASKHPAGLARYSNLLPATIAASYLIGYALYKAGPQFEMARNNAPMANLADWLVLLILTVFYLRFAKGKLAGKVPGMARSLVLSALLSWGTGALLVLTQADALGNHYLSVLAYLALSSGIAVWYGLSYGNHMAVYATYGLGAGVAVMANVWTNWAGPEVFGLIAAGYAILGNRIREAKIAKFKGTLVRWGLPLGIFLVTSAGYSVSYAASRFSTQTALEAGRFIAVGIVSTIGVLAGIRLGNRGITTASTTALMLALVPGLWFRIEDLTASATTRNETKALLVAVTVYSLTYIFRKNTSASLPSLVIWGVPVVIALSLSFTDALSATSHVLTAEDWIRFGVVMSAATTFLVLGAIRRIAGMFYPGLLTVVATVSPYSWQQGGFFWVVLLALAALIVWVAIRLDRFTGWLKALD